MNFELDEENIAIKNAAKDFAIKELLPSVIQRDEDQYFSIDLARKMGEMGFMGMMVDPYYGGSGTSFVSYVLVIEEIAKIDASMAVCMSVNNSLVCYGLQQYGTEEQKNKYLFPVASGKEIGAFCLSEPEAGSDATAIKTKAEDSGSYYLLNGTKNWITNAKSAAFYLVIAQSDPSKGYKGINAFIVDKESEGLKVGPKENKLGIRGSETHSITFQDVKVPKKNLIGKEGKGFRFAMETLNGGRIGIAGQALGIACGAYERALNYSRERQAFGRKISDYQAIQFKLADMAVKIEAARNLMLKAASLKDQKLDYANASAMAKLYASQIAMEVTTEALQIHGGYGYVKEYHVERLFRDAKITQIYEGTSEIQKIVISRNILN